MSIRVTYNQMYSGFTNNINKNLSEYIESVNQSSSQKKVNRPSDNPSGAGLILSYRASLEVLSRYDSNIKTAQGWLTTADTALASEGSVQSVLTKMKTLTQQGASGTYTPENRKQISIELRQLFSELVSLSNSSYNGNSIFAGQKTDSPAYEEKLATTINNNDDMSIVTSSKGTASSAEVVATGSFKGVVEVRVDTIDNSTGKITYSYRTNGGGWSKSQESQNSTELEIPNAGKLTLKNGTLQKGEIFTISDPTVTGGSSTSIIIQAIDTDNDPPLKGDVRNAEDASYRYSKDGGTTWETIKPPYSANPHAVEGNNLTLELDGISVTVNKNAQVTTVDPDNIHEANNGTWIYVRPTAIYKGDDSDTKVTAVYGEVKGSASGYFSSDVTVRIDDADGQPMVYSYSNDGGSTWTQAKTNDPLRLAVPGGFLTLDGPAADLKDNDQYIIHPYRADINIPISDSDAITVNLVGKDVFGGLYTDPTSGKTYAVNGDSSNNIFEAAGRLVGYAETGSQEGMQKALDELETCMKGLMTNAAAVGGRSNRLEVTSANISLRKLDAEEGLSDIEDVDATELMNRLSKQINTYNAVLKSSSMIMQMSLVNYL